MKDGELFDLTVEESRLTLLVDDTRTDYPARVICRTIQDALAAILFMEPKFETLLLDGNLFAVGGCIRDSLEGVSLLTSLSALREDLRPKRIISVSATAAKEITKAAAALIGEENVGWIEYSGIHKIYHAGVKEAG